MFHSDITHTKWNASKNAAYGWLRSEFPPPVPALHPRLTQGGSCTGAPAATTPATRVRTWRLTRSGNTPPILLISRLSARSAAQNSRLNRMNRGTRQRSTQVQYWIWAFGIPFLKRGLASVPVQVCVGLLMFVQCRKRGVFFYIFIGKQNNRNKVLQTMKVKYIINLNFFCLSQIRRVRLEWEKRSSTSRKSWR